jgi:flagellar FliJ protein
MAFQFRFQAVLELRRRERDQAGAAVGQADAAIRKIDDQIAAVRGERGQLRQETSASLRGTLSVDALLSQGRYDLQLQAQTESLAQARNQLVEERARRHQQLIEAEAEVKRFERLEQRQRDAYLSEQRSREQSESDDATGRRYALARQQAHRIQTDNGRHQP